MAIELHELGFIIGGQCQKRLHSRRQREVGCRMAWSDIKKQDGYVTENKGWFQIVKPLKSRKPGQYGGGNIEVGYLRMIQLLFEQLIKSGKKFRLKWMATWINAIAALEFMAMGETPFDLAAVLMNPPKGTDDALYEKLYGVKRGLVRMKK